MKTLKKLTFALILGAAFSCQDDDNTTTENVYNIDTSVDFNYKSTINIGGEGASEISAFDATTNKLYIVNVENNEESVIVSIKDQGIGIPKEYIHRVTERFFRVNPSKSKDVGGTGLGLAIVKHIINQHRADMDIKSEEGVGTEFILKFPAI